MKLSDLVNYRNQLNRLHIEDARTKVDLDISHIKHLINNKDFDPNNLKQQIQDKHHEIHQKFDEFIKLIEQAKREAQEEISLKEEYWLNETPHRQVALRLAELMPYRKNRPDNTLRAGQCCALETVSPVS